MKPIYSIVEFSYDITFMKTNVRLAVFTSLDQKVKYDEAVKNLIDNHKKMNLLLKKGETVYKTETEKYKEIFSDAFKEYLQKEQLTPSEVSGVVQEKYQNIDPVKSGRTDAENTELRTLEIIINTPLPYVETKNICIDGVLDFSAVLESLAKHLDTVL